MAVSEQKHYVLQYRKYPQSNKWETLAMKHDSYEEAEARRQQMIAPHLYRVAESYTVVRYRAVKLKGGRI